MLRTMKPVEFLGSSYKDLLSFPKPARRAAGAELRRVQLGTEPRDFKSMASVGKGVFEIRLHLEGSWRVMYVAKFETAVYVLHAFQKKTQKTAKGDIEVAAKRYKKLSTDLRKLRYIDEKE